MFADELRAKMSAEDFDKLDRLVQKQDELIDGPCASMQAVTEWLHAGSAISCLGDFIQSEIDLYHAVAHNFPPALQDVLTTAASELVDTVGKTYDLLRVYFQREV
jgi:hypothetical protein